MGGDGCRDGYELSKLSDEALLAYIQEQREANRPECAKHAIQVLAFGHLERIHYLVAGKVPPEDVDEVAGIVLDSALHSAFDGRSVGEFIVWLKVIARRRIADYHRRREGRPVTTPLVSEHGGEEEIWGEEPAADDDADVIAIREAAGRVLERRTEIHQHVIRLNGPNELGYMGLGAAEVAANVKRMHGVDMSEANVHQIWSRFKRDLADELGLGGS